VSTVGRTYLEGGQPVVVLVAAQRVTTSRRPPRSDVTLTSPATSKRTDRCLLAPFNVLIRRHDGTQVVRPFRGLRKAKLD